jgi:biopolymer transport protein ExbB
MEITAMMGELTNGFGMMLTLAQDSAAPSAPETTPLLGYIHKGGIISYVLVLLSFVAVAMVIWNMIELRRVRLMPPHVVEGLSKLLNARQVDAAIEFSRRQENSCFLAKVMAAGLSRAQKSPFGMLEVRAKLEDAASRELEVLDRPTNAIGMLAAIGPMLGLLGTVIGLIGAFGALSGMEGAARSNELSKFMSIALVCTAEGLLLAIPCTFLYAMFKRHTTRVVGQVGEEAETLVAALQVPAGPAQGAPGGAARAAAPVAQARPVAQQAAPAPQQAVPVAPARAGNGW